MARTVAIGIQSFSDLIRKGYFYVDKTAFIREWWEKGDSVTLIVRPRRFGKTLNMSMTECFFSLDYAGQGDLFEGLSVWEEKKYREIQGTCPVISFSFANVKETNYLNARKKICMLLAELYTKNAFLLKSQVLDEKDKAFFRRVSGNMDDVDATLAIHYLSKFLYQYYGKKVIILLDEYDTPMQEAYVNGYWDELVAFIRGIFHSSFKTNPWLERGLMTGITRVSKESIFSDLNNMEVVTATSDKYATSFGFTEEEVFTALEECGLRKEKDQVKKWYDGFVFGSHQDIYNPWSILNFLDKGKYNTYWANTSSNSLVGKLLREGSRSTKEQFEKLLGGESLWVFIDEQIIYHQLNGNENAIWSLLLAGGYLKVLSCGNCSELSEGTGRQYELTLTNLEVKVTFRSMVHGWFAGAEADYNDFIKALLRGDVEAMNDYMNEISMELFSSFDTGTNPSRNAPERFYHGFVLGLMVDLRNRYIITSNRESGFGRYDVMLEPRAPGKDDGIIIEFKVVNPRRESSMEEAVQAALRQIEDKQYEAALVARGIPGERIRKYGFAFEGKNVLIG